MIMAGELHLSLNKRLSVLYESQKINITQYNQTYI